MINAAAPSSTTPIQPAQFGSGAGEADNSQQARAAAEPQVSTEKTNNSASPTRTNGNRSRPVNGSSSGHHQ